MVFISFFSRFRLQTALSILVSLLSSCYVGPGSPLLTNENEGIHAYKFDGSNTLNDSEIVKVILDDVDAVIINGVKVDKADYQQIHLGPGIHEVTWSKTFGFSVLVEPSMVRQFSETARINMEPKHTYTLHADRSHGHGYKLFFWIEDKQTGQVVYGKRKP